MTDLSASDIAGKRIREAREAKKWRIKDLAGQCAKAGDEHLTADVLTNLETRRKPRQLTVDELLTLAHVLDVPPIQLISPLRAGERLRITPGRIMDVLEAAEWLGNEDEESLHLWPGPNPASMLRYVRYLSRLIRTGPDRLEDSGNAKARDMMIKRGQRIGGTLGRLADLGYETPELDPETIAVLRNLGQPATLPEWRSQELGGERE